jgi:alcohol dehydrogenase class IV
MRFCAARQPGLYRRVGLACDLDVLRCTDPEADQRTIEFMTRFLADLGLAGRLRAFGAKPELLEDLTTQAWEDPCHKTNAVPVTCDDLRSLYAELL